jgi:hypothetical protein
MSRFAVHSTVTPRVRPRRASMRAQAVVLALLLSACSGPSAVPSAAPARVASPSTAASSAAPDRVASPSTAASTAATACRPPRDPIGRPTGETITAAIPLGCEGGAVAVSGGSIWVIPHLDRVVLRIDPTTNDVVDRIPLGDRGPGAEIDAAEDMLWASVSSPSYEPERLVRLDPTSGSVVAWVDAPAWSPVIGAGFVWGHGARGVYRIAPDTNAVAAVIEIGDCRVIAIDNQAFCVGAESVVAIDPQTDNVEPIAHAPSIGWPVETAGGLIWGSNETSLSAFDPEARKVAVELTPPPGTATWGLEAVVLDGILWMAANSKPGDRTRTAPDSLVRIDPVTMVVECVIKIPNPEFGMAAGFGSIWFSVVRQPWLLRMKPACD